MAYQVSLQINADTTEELKTALTKLLTDLDSPMHGRAKLSVEMRSPAATVPAPSQDTVRQNDTVKPAAPSPDPATADGKPKKTQGRRKSKATVDNNGASANPVTPQGDGTVSNKQPAAVETPSSPPAATPQAADVTNIHVQNALKDVMGAIGIDAARKILADVGASRVSEIKPEQYASVIEACNKALKP